jgi:uncharacterized protein (DUF1697 family)
MAELRALLARMGYTDIATLLNSGNAVFNAAKGTPALHAAAIAAAVARDLRVDVPVSSSRRANWPASWPGTRLPWERSTLRTCWSLTCRMRSHLRVLRLWRGSSSGPSGS